MLKSGHSEDTHVIDQTYLTSDKKEFHIYGIFDFGRYTFRILKDRVTVEDIRNNEYRKWDFMVPQSIFPGAKGCNRPALSPDIAPSKFQAIIK